MLLASLRKWHLATIDYYSVWIYLARAEGAAEPMECLTEIEVRYAETDCMGVVYHANYLIYLEVARTEFLEKLGYPYCEIEKAGYMSPVLHVDLTYGSPFRYGDTVLVRTRVTKVTSVKTEYTCEMYLKGEDPTQCKPHFKAVTHHCLVERDSFKVVSQKKVFPRLYKAYCDALEAK